MRDLSPGIVLVTCLHASKPHKWFPGLRTIHMTQNSMHDWSVVVLAISADNMRRIAIKKRGRLP